MSQSTELHVPDGYYPPYAVVTDTDHGAYIIIAASLGMTFVLVSSAIRIFLRFSFAQRAGLDDAFLAAATVSGARDSPKRARVVLIVTCRDWL